MYRKALDKELYDKVYDNYIHPYRPEAQEAMNEMFGYDDEDDYEDDEDDNDYANDDGTLQSSVNYHSKRDPKTGRFIKG